MVSTDIAISLDPLKDSDPVLSQLIEQIGTCNLPPKNQNPNLFLELVRAIISQQISTAAAKTIYQRLLDLYDDALIDPQTLLATPEEKLRSAGISQKKVTYLKDLAEKVLNSLPAIIELEKMEDEAIIDVLTQVKGVGRWTVQMLLIFTFGRLNVLPVDDLGVRKAIKQLYNLKELPKPKVVEEIARSWHPFCSVAVWYLWRSLDI